MTLRDNFNTIHQLLGETLDASRHPLTTSPNALRDIVLPPSLITKIFTATDVSGLSGPTSNSMSALSSDIPWRKAGVQYNNNEVLPEVEILLRAALSVKPGMLLTLTNAHTFLPFTLVSGSCLPM